MSTSPELKQEDQVGGEQAPQPVVEQAPKTEIQAVEEKAATTTPAQITAQVQDDTAQTQKDDTQIPVITITVPATPQQLEDWSKGPPENSLTWAAFYWIRMIKKAILHGWRVISNPPATVSLNA